MGCSHPRLAPAKPLDEVSFGEQVEVVCLDCGFQTRTVVCVRGDEPPGGSSHIQDGADKGVLVDAALEPA